MISRRPEADLARREKTRARLISAAARVIAQLGRSKATIDDFISAAGVARGTFYNYFPTREHMIDALWAHLGRAPFVEIHERCGKIEDPAFRLLAETKLVIARTAIDDAWGWLIYSLSGDEEDVNEDLLTFPLPTLEAGVAQARFRVGDINAARDGVVAMVRRGMLAVLCGRGSAEYQKAILEMMLLSLGIAKKEIAVLLNKEIPEADDLPGLPYG